MTGAHQQVRTTGAARRLPALLLLSCLVALISVLQGAVSPVAPSPGMRLASGIANLETVDGQHPAAIEAGLAAAAIVFEKRLSGGRTVPVGEDAVAAVADAPAAAVTGGIGARATSPRTGPGPLAGLTFTARGPPAA